MSPSDLHRIAVAAEHLTGLLPVALQDEATVAAMELLPGQPFLSVGLPVCAAHMDTTLPKAVDGVLVVYSFDDPEVMY